MYDQGTLAFGTLDPRGTLHTSLTKERTFLTLMYTILILTGGHVTVGAGVETLRHFPEIVGLA